ncbi:hypothetical protein FORC066_2574 [Yersinia enterocolitica]|nr:hypothetical protein FORC066_2574 [Yersinia enterocolitica]
MDVTYLVRQCAGFIGSFYAVPYDDDSRRHEIPLAITLWDEQRQGCQLINDRDPAL